MLETQANHAAASSLSLRGQAFINGRAVPASSGKTFESINPATGRVLARIAEGDAQDIDQAVRSARAAFESGSWSAMAPKQRKRVLLRFADLMEKHLEELALMEVLDCGKPIGDARAVDLP